jgi:hypothetical protein
MKNRLFTLLLLAATTMTAIGQCPDSVTCDSNGFKFHYQNTPNNGLIDSLRVKVNGTTMNLDITSVTSTEITTGLNGLGCNDVATQIKYHYNNTFVGFTCTNNTPLPVELMYFDVSRKGNRVTLNWATAMELNFSHFEVQKSFNAEDWEVIDVIYGEGDGASIVTYSATDNIDRVTYYRLKEVDYDGTYKYSSVSVAKYTSVEVSSVRFISLDGVEVSESYDGPMIIRTEYTDGSISRVIQIQ